MYIKRTKIDPLVVLSPQQRKVLGVKNDGISSFSSHNEQLLKAFLLDVGFITSTPSSSPVLKKPSSIPYIPVGSSPSSPLKPNEIKGKLNVPVVLDNQFSSRF